ncbi:hypothetical protein WT41_11640 [Burkholderia territorii]|uniref:hypothetical protein n=1 Tax=Burkholderia territorii TaxID=1503055 RepID=UPI00075F6481|nr:hypothetical protein [Burkholderia territorii]KWA18974.1 hypothetical protein WT38_23385 [Burkholderia territorii]KWA45175.1 hypothetical protein WT41_11640 [Burkholderia territorii]
MPNETEARRALLVHLGSILRTLSCVLEYEPDDRTLDSLLAAQPMLADIPLLNQVFAHMTVREFTRAVLHAYCLWPQLLLDEPLDRDALAEPVCAWLFADNPGGWTRYVALLGAEIPWFGQGMGPSRSSGRRPARTSSVA